MIPEVGDIKFEQAMDRFDKIERKMPAWKGWEEQPGHEFVIVREKDRHIYFYPVKYIIAVATGLSEVNIEDDEVLNYANSHKLRVVSAAKYLEQVVPEKEKPAKSKITTSKAVTPVSDAQLFNPALLLIRIERFKETQHKSFTEEFYLEDERNYKVDASKLLHEELGKNGEKLKAMIDTGDFKETAGLIRSLYQKENLLYKPWEILPFLKAEDEPFVRLLYDLLYGERKFSIRFQNWIDLLSKDNVLCWPAATYHLMLHNPKDHIFVKPGTIGKFLKAVGSGLVWQPRTNPIFYAEIQRFAKAILPELEPLGARDMIDVQSFTWVLREFE